MRVEVHGNVLLCEQCSRAPRLAIDSMVGPGKVFDRACPHIEVVFLEWHREEMRREPTRWCEVWQPFCIGFILGASIAAAVFW